MRNRSRVSNGRRRDGAGQLGYVANVVAALLCRVGGATLYQLRWSGKAGVRGIKEPVVLHCTSRSAAPSRSQVTWDARGPTRRRARLERIEPRATFAVWRYTGGAWRSIATFTP